MDLSHKNKREPLWKFFSLIFMFLIFCSVGFLMIPLHISDKRLASDNKKHILTKYTLSGGTVGFCNSLIIYEDGSGVYKDDCRNISREIKLDESSYSQLSNFSKQLVSFKMRNSGNNVRDGLAMELAFNGQGKLLPYELQKEVIVGVLNSIIFDKRVEISSRVE
jgi:hypothetical protein